MDGKELVKIKGLIRVQDARIDRIQKKKTPFNAIKINLKDVYITSDIIMHRIC